MPRPEIDPSVSARFADVFKNTSPDVRIEDGALLFVHRYLTEKKLQVIRRAYAHEMITPKGSKYASWAHAFFTPGERYPEYIELLADPTKPRGESRFDMEDQNSIWFKLRNFNSKGEDIIHISRSLGNTFIGVDINRQRDRLDRLHLQVGDKYVDTSLLRRIPRTKANPDAYLAAHGITRDKEQGTVHLSLGGIDVEAHMRIPTEEVLARFFPEALLGDPFGSPAELDGWAQEDIFGAFGITIKEAPLEKPVLENSITTQAQSQ